MQMECSLRIMEKINDKNSILELTKKIEEGVEVDVRLLNNTTKICSKCNPHNL